MYKLMIKGFLSSTLYSYRQYNLVNTINLLVRVLLLIKILAIMLGNVIMYG